MVVTKLCSGCLVVLRVRWSPSANLLGLVIGQDGKMDPRWLVLWTTGDRLTQLTWHLANALLVVDDANLVTVKDRCQLGHR